jgi:histidyl-tRNA synthetase
MVNQRINSLPKPIKWFSVPRLFRAERPQKGRLREFFQWNIDIIGVDDVLADAEIIFTTIDYLREVGLTPRDIRIKISSRKLLASSLANIGVAENRLDPLYATLDKYRKIPNDIFEKMLADQVCDPAIVKKIMYFMAAPTPADVRRIAGTDSEVEAAIQELARLKELLEQMGVWEYCDLEPSIVRGLAYYTGVVFEVHQFAQELRAIAGGGRFDNLLHDFGGPKLPATGMGMGDCVLGILLEEKGLIPKELSTQQLDYFVALADKGFTRKVYEITAQLRRKNFSANFSYKPLAGLSKQLKEASAQNAKKCVIIGVEIERNQVTVKDMATGKQELVELDKLLT